MSNLEIAPFEIRKVAVFFQLIKPSTVAQPARRILIQELLDAFLGLLRYLWRIIHL